MIFQGGGGGGGRTPCPPSGSARGMHLKEGTCVKCSFQRVVIIGRKVGQDYSSWYACLPLIRHVGRSSRSKRFASFEVETARCLHTNLLFWLGFLKYRNTMFGSVNLSCYNCFRWGPKTQTYRAHRLLHGKVGHSTVSFYRMHTFLNWRNVLSWIPFGSDLDPNRVCKERERERLVQAHQSKHSIGGSTMREREREREWDVCVLFEFRQFFFYSGNSSTYRSLQKNWSYEMSSGFNSWVQY